MPPDHAIWKICAAQEVGGRSEQQDAGNAWIDATGKIVLAVLADGAGGHHGGQRAAQAAVAAARALWEAEPPRDAEADFLEKISRAAHEAIRGEFSGPAAARATWIALLATEHEAYWVHSGDSRLYHFAGGRQRCRTRDHSIAQVLVDQGKITKEEAHAHPDRSTLFQSLGGDEYLAVESGSAVLSGDDFFLLCTDGVWNQVEENEFMALAGEESSRRQHHAEELVRRAVERAGADADNASLLGVTLKFPR
jgi:serine/threonine protein phosphatase PrpC